MGGSGPVRFASDSRRLNEISGRCKVVRRTLSRSEGPRSEVHAPPHPHSTPSTGALVRMLRRDWRESRAFSAESPALHFRWCIDTLLEPAGMPAPVNETFLLPLQRC